MINRHYVHELETAAWPQFIDVTDQVRDDLQACGVLAGVVTVYSQHTSCCVLIQEDSEDVTEDGVPLVLQDTLNVLHQLIPPARHQGHYLHPGPIHLQNAAELRGELHEWGLNTDGHIISSLFGRSESIPVVDRTLLLGEFGRIYFADLDSVRARVRTVRVHVIGE